MPKLKVRSDLRDIVDLAHDAGWEVTNAKGHLKFTSPTGQTITSASTPSDRRGLLNLRAQLRGAGLPIGTRGKSMRPVAIVSELDPVTAIDDEMEREMIRDLKVEVRADIYNLAGIMYEAYEEQGLAQGDEPDDELIEFLRKGRGAMTTIGDRVRGDLDMNLLADICDSVFAKISANIVSRNCERDTERPGRWLYPFPLRGLIAGVINDTYMHDKINAVTVPSYMDAVYRMLKTDQAGERAMILLRRPDRELGVTSLWSVADKWEAPRGIVVTLHHSRRDSLVATNRERKLTPHEAGEDRAPEPVTITLINNTQTPKEEAAVPIELVEKPVRGARPRDPENPPATWQPRGEDDADPWLCEEEGCGFRGPTIFVIQGHRLRHKDGDWHARSIATREARRHAAKEAAATKPVKAAVPTPKETPKPEAPEAVVPTPEPATDIRAAVRDALLDILAGSEGDGARITEIKAERDRAMIDLTTATQDRDLAVAERDEAVAALRLLLTDYINPRIVAGAIDVAKYIEPPAPGENPIV